MAVLPPDPVFSLRCREQGAVYSICFHQNERLLAGTGKGSVFLWDLQTNRSSLHFSIGSNPITSLHHTDDTLISQEKGGSIKLWSMSNTGYKQQRSIEAQHLGFCKTALFASAAQLLFYPCEENSIGVLHVNDAAMPTQMLVPDNVQLPKLGSICCLKPFEYAEQLYVLAGYESGHFLTWQLSTGTVVHMLELSAEPIACDYDPVTNRGIVGGTNDTLASFTYQRPAMQLQRSSSINIKNSGINAIRIRADQKVFATGGWDGRIRIFSWKSLRPLAVLTAHKAEGIMDIVYSDSKVAMWNARIMAAAGMDGQITLWDLYN